MFENHYIETLARRLPMLHQLQQKLDTCGTLLPDSDPIVAEIIFPSSDLAGLSFERALAMLEEERVEIYLELIKLQYALAKTGIRRVRSLINMFDFYVRDILGRGQFFAKLDIYQQATDVSLMYVINHSQLSFVADMIGEDDLRYIAAKNMVDEQEEEYKAFQLDELVKFEQHKYKDCGIVGVEQRREYFLQYEMDILDVADYNIVLALQTEKLLKNGMIARYHWLNALGRVRGQTGNSDFFPHDDLKYDTEIQDMYLERCEILLSRAEDAYKIASLISP